MQKGSTEKNIRMRQANIIGINTVAIRSCNSGLVNLQLKSGFYR